MERQQVVEKRNWLPNFDSADDRLPSELMEPHTMRIRQLLSRHILSRLILSRLGICLVSVTLPQSLSLAQSPCCQPATTAGCADTSCSEVVCQHDPYCCTTAWDQRCATEASVLCPACNEQSPCLLPSPDDFEWEPCGAELDDPCGLAGTTAQSIQWNRVLHGTAWAGDQTRDVDWFEIVLAEPSLVQVECWSDGPIGIAIMDDGCPPTMQNDGPDGCPARFTACLPLGVYRIVVRSLLFEPIDCGDSLTEYALRVSRSPCTPDRPDNDSCDSAQFIQEGVNSFDSTEATTEPAWLPEWCNEGAGLTLTHDVWFSFTASQSAVYRISTCGFADFDSRIALYEACGEGVLACSDDACPDGGAAVEVGLACGSTSLIRVGGWGHGAGAELEISVVETSACNCPADLDGDR